MGAHLPPNSLVLHASTVSVAERAVLIRGASGTGKSSLALQLIALGAGLIADDRTILHQAEDHVLASAPETIRGKIEARGVGILALPPAPPARVCLIVDMDRIETERLPPLRVERVLGHSLPMLRKSSFAHFPAAILLYLKGERSD